MFYPFLRKLLFSLPPETAHELTLELARLSPVLGKLTGSPNDLRLKVKVGQTEWISPIGLAAGLDKNAEALEFFSQQGFGAIECGTITLKPQEGNPKPRIFRYPAEKSLRNAMGFPNHGLNEVASNLRLHGQNLPLPLGANIGKNKNTSPENSIEELCTLHRCLYSLVDYFVVNVSSPNTPGLRALQEKGYLKELFSELQKNNTKDLYLKISPDLDQTKIIELTELAQEMKLTGLMATNTTIKEELGVGGVSGELLTHKARAVRKSILDMRAEIEVIGIGGISSAKDLFDFWEDGGKAVQIYTAYIFQGPAILSGMHKEIFKFLKFHDLLNLEDFFKHDPILRKEMIRKYRKLD